MAATATSSFLNSIGVNTHMSFFDRTWADQDAVLNALAYTGITNVRDGAPYEATLGIYERMADAGIKFDLLINGPTIDPAKDIAFAAQLEASRPGSVAFIEGPNEVNLFNTTYNGVALKSHIALARDIQQEIYDEVTSNAHLDNTSIISFSIGGAGPWEAAATIGDYDQLTDYSNWHIYYPNGTQPYDLIQEQIGWAGVLNSDTLIFTETGYSTGYLASGNLGVDDLTQAKQIVNLLFDSYSSGVEKTYLYDLMDEFVNPAATDHEGNFGIFNGDGSPKLAATAIHNLNEILADNGDGNFNTSDLDYTLSNMPADAHSFLMQKSDGTFELAIWGEADSWDETNNTSFSIPDTNVTVNLAEAATVNIYDPLVGENAIRTLTDVTAFDVGISDHAMIVEILAGGGNPPVPELQVIETPVEPPVETPVVDVPVTETPVAETPVEPTPIGSEEPESPIEVPPADDTVHAHHFVTGNGERTLGIAESDLTVTHDTTATLTFEDAYAGYQNTFGVYSIGSDGEIGDVHVAWKNLNAAHSGDTFDFDVMAGDDIGLFLISDGNQRNDFGDLDLDSGTLSFIFNYHQDGERPANIHDDGDRVSLVYQDGDGGEDIVINGDVLHGNGVDGTSLNADGDIHVMAAASDDGSELMIGFEDMLNGDRDYEDANFSLHLAPTTGAQPVDLAGIVEDQDDLTAAITDFIQSTGPGTVGAVASSQTNLQAQSEIYTPAVAPESDLHTLLSQANAA